jgi:hypothetical protein
VGANPVGGNPVGGSPVGGNPVGGNAGKFSRKLILNYQQVNEEVEDQRTKHLVLR